MYKKPKVLIFIVCYNAEKFIGSVLRRIPKELYDSRVFDIEILIIDDQSKDQTFDRARFFADTNREIKINVLYNPVNQGYGGNQKIGYYYAIKNSFDVVVLLHGDGQYAPELIPNMVQPIVDGKADVVLGSRMQKKIQALKGGMPLYKWIGNQFLTFWQNFILRTNLSEFHTGYRAYRVSALASIPFPSNSPYFDFDTEILIQMIDSQRKITEIPIPTYYGEEFSRVNSIYYGLLILWTSLISRLMKLGLYYNPKFDYTAQNEYYSLKLGYPSSHQFALDQITPGSIVLDIGCGPGLMAKELFHKSAKLISIDKHINEQARQYSWKAYQADLENYDFCSTAEKVDYILILDIIEHLRSPEAFLGEIREAYCYHSPKIILTTGNIAFLPLRISLLLGQFNYGKKGILDLTHTRLFTFKSLKRLCIQSGYRVVSTSGIPAPFPLAIGENWFSRMLLNVNRILITLSSSLFSYQLAFIVEPQPTLSMLLSTAEFSSHIKQEDVAKSRERNLVAHLQS